MREKRLNEIKGVILIAAGLLILASFISFTPFDLAFYTSHPNSPPQNWIRTFGAYGAGAFFFLFGWASYLVPACILFLGFRRFNQKAIDIRLPQIISLLVLLLSASSLIGLSLNNEYVAFSRGGSLGFLISHFVSTYFGRLGGVILFVTLLVLSSALLTEALISVLFLKVMGKLKSLVKKPTFTFKIKPKSNSLKIDVDAKKQRPVSLISEPKPKISAQGTPSREEGATKPKIQIQTKSEEISGIKARPKEIPIGDYHLPSLDLLESPPPIETRQIKEDLANNARILEETLDDFGISAKVTDIEKGPVITRYELEPAPGVKLNRIVALGDDIALAMKAQSIRIVAPIPGKARVGVEVPNIQSSFVYFTEILSSKEFQEADGTLILALGKDIAGHPVVTDLGDMPHILIAGTTGSGKTVCVNSLILSLLFRFSPRDLKLLMVDPKMVELMPFNGLPHLLCPVVTDAKKASAALAWVVNEMEDRYQLLAKAATRNIEAYNGKQEEKMPYIVVIIDELADLMMIARDQIESAITRLAQLSRAVGIHLILATQRPSVDVVTGIIKANFPARISFKVASKVDSRTVLDTNGADKLLGKGDMLFLRPGESKLTRAQGALVADREIERVVSFIKDQAEPLYDEQILMDQHKAGLHGRAEKDELYDEAVRVIIESSQASVSILQRRLRLGYTRAARIIDMMEQEGMVGPFEGSKPRRLLVDRDAWLKEHMRLEEKETVE